VVADYDYLDARELTFEYDEGEVPVDSGNGVVGLYRAKRQQYGDREAGRIYHVDVRLFASVRLSV
jgi:hypothetical protein